MPTMSSLKVPLLEARAEARAEPDPVLLFSPVLRRNIVRTLILCVAICLVQIAASYHDAQSTIRSYTAAALMGLIALLTWFATYLQLPHLHPTASDVSLSEIIIPRGVPVAPSATDAKPATEPVTDGELLFSINGVEHRLTNPSPALLLADYLRSLGLTGTKVACGEVAAARARSSPSALTACRARSTRACACCARATGWPSRPPKGSAAKRRASPPRRRRSSSSVAASAASARPAG